MDNIKDLILSSYDIAITSHSDEDADAFGSSMALRLALMSLGKNVDYYVSLPLEHRLQFFPKDYIIYDEEKHTKKYDLCICLDSADEKRLGKRIKRLGIHELLVEGKSVSDAANFMRGMGWREIDSICRGYGF